jgi:hypothetical protein
MNSSFWQDAVLDPLRRFTNEALTFLLNNFLAMVVVLLVGVLVAYVVRLAVRLILRAFRFDRACERQGLVAALRTAGITQTPTAAAARLAYWGVMFVFLLLAVAALDVQPMNDLISRVFLFLPQVLSALLILVLGYLAAAFLQRATLLAAVNAGVPRARVLASAVQVLALLFTVAVALEQAGIGRYIVLATFSVAFGTVGLAAALAFGWAARDFARTVLERQLAAADREGLGEMSHL